jgi:hypothetical protein
LLLLLNVPVQVVDELELAVLVTVQVGPLPVLKKCVSARAAGANNAPTATSATAGTGSSRRNLMTSTSLRRGAARPQFTEDLRAEERCSCNTQAGNARFNPPTARIVIPTDSAGESRPDPPIPWRPFWAADEMVSNGCRFTPEAIRQVVQESSA